MLFRSAFGPIKRTIDHEGTVKTEYEKDKSIRNADLFKNLMNSNSPGGGGGSNMFGSQAGTMMNMFQRLAPNAQSAAKQTVERTNSGPDAMKLMQVIRTAVDGGNPISSIQSLMV